MARTPASPPPMQVPTPVAQPVAPSLHVMSQEMTKATLLEAIAAASSGFGDLVKDSKNDYLKSNYLALPGLLKAIKPALLEQGVVVYSQIVYDQSCWIVRTTVAFVDGTEEFCSDFPITDPSNQQRVGSAVTYGTRYNLFALLAICPENDDDGNSGGHSTAPTTQALPGLPSIPAYPMPGQQTQAPVATYQQVTPQGWPVISTMPPGIVNPVQPIPVLQ